MVHRLELLNGWPWREGEEDVSLLTVNVLICGAVDVFISTCVIEWFISQRYHIHVPLRWLGNVQLQVSHLQVWHWWLMTMQSMTTYFIASGTPYSSSLVLSEVEKHYVLSILKLCPVNHSPVCGGTNTTFHVDFLIPTGLTVNASSHTCLLWCPSSQTSENKYMTNSKKCVCSHWKIKLHFFNIDQKSI